METRFLVKQQVFNQIYGVTYRWNEDQTQATLVPDQGMDEEILVYDQGMVRTQLPRSQHPRLLNVDYRVVAGGSRY